MKIHIDELGEIARKYKSEEISLSKFCELLNEFISPQPFPGIEKRAKELWPLVDRRDIYAGDRFKAIQLATEATEQLRGEAAKWNEIAGQNARDCLSLQQQLTLARERIKELELLLEGAVMRIKEPSGRFVMNQNQFIENCEKHFK